LVATALGHSPRLRHSSRHHRRYYRRNHFDFAAHPQISLPARKVVTHSQDALKPLIPVCQCVFSWKLALSLFEIVRAEGVRPFVLLGALVMVVAGGAWLLDEFVLRR
jgi:hypothetical protein